MKDVVRTTACERARAWAALAPDDELSELERRLVCAHLARCPSCASFSAAVATLVDQMRRTPLEPVPAGARSVAWRRRTLVPAMRTIGRGASVAAAAAAGIVAFSIGAVAFGDAKHVPAPAPVLIEITATDLAQELDALRDARRADLLAAAPGIEAGEHTGPNPL